MPRRELTPRARTRPAAAPLQWTRTIYIPLTFP